MDLTLPIGDVVLNIRVALIVKTKKGFIFERHKTGYYFLVGGRVKAGESSEQAVRREAMEEIGIPIKNLKMKAIIENFYISHEKQVHELCFVYQTEEIVEKEFGKEFFIYNKAEIDKIDLQPKIMGEVIVSENKEILHLISK
jgi:8-oxo-dGTP pyrophosphatase MutT (NUDIX family)